ncbi:hypothetical protein OIU85_022111 [Salix viminalis]|uniref:Uncharacterized protein n=1 Tax=Salix viminalis TaxID=40686 RepID=A0A9Q0U653_SALVM|nr:hypothetical protein OIU85_022111 [Salix viminalis]
MPGSLYATSKEQSPPSQIGCCRWRARSQAYSLLSIYLHVSLCSSSSLSSLHVHIELTHCFQNYMEKSFLHQRNHLLAYESGHWNLKCPIFNISCCFLEMILSYFPSKLNITTHIVFFFICVRVCFFDSDLIGGGAS